MYYFTYYSKYYADAPAYKMNMLKALTSVPLEIGNVVHDVMEAFLKRLQKSDSRIDEKRFFEFAEQKMYTYFSRKTFLEVYYKQCSEINTERASRRIAACLQNFIESPAYSWIFMKAITNKLNWMIEPDGFGETRLNGLKAYCKIDFLFPVDDHVYILDWKTGRKNPCKHQKQLIGYAAAVQSNFGIPWHSISPKIIYLFPEFEETGFPVTENVLEEFYNTVAGQTEQLRSFCKDPENNIPKAIEEFPRQPSPQLCKNCNFQELCFPEGLEMPKEAADW